MKTKPQVPQCDGCGKPLVRSGPAGELTNKISQIGLCWKCLSTGTWEEFRGEMK